MDRAALYVAVRNTLTWTSMPIGFLDRLAGQALTETGDGAPLEKGRPVGASPFRRAGVLEGTRQITTVRTTATSTGCWRPGPVFPLLCPSCSWKSPKRIGLRCRGVGLPGHFLVGLEGQDLYLDPFNAGNLLTADGCRGLVYDLFGERMSWSDDFLVPCTKYDFLFRLLNN